jgi:hypothetical protein
MLQRSIIILLLLSGFFLSSPTIKATFSEAKPLDTVRSERAEFEKKLSKPFESFFSLKKKKKNLTKGVEADVPQLVSAPEAHFNYTQHLSYDGFLYLSFSDAANFLRGPPIA